MSPLRKAPVTAECIIVCVALFVVCHIQAMGEVRFRDAQRQWGAALTLQVVPARDGAPGPIHRQLYGPFDLWDGQWWRIPINAFHHANFLHLLLNSLSAWYLGTRLEQRWGSLRLALFLVPAVVIPILAEFLIGNAAVGFSGAICAMLGALIVLQKIDPRDGDLPDEAIQLTLGLLLLGIPATAMEVIDLANAAHISGVAWGCITAGIMCGSWSYPWTARAGFAAAHLALIPALWLACHPPRDGRYLWYRAENCPDARQREQLFEQAIHVEPSLTGVWLRLVNHRMAEGDVHGMWTLLVEGLSHSPTDADLFEATRSVWRRLPHGPEREFAEAELRRVFGTRASDWSRQIRNGGLASARLGKDHLKAGSREPELDPAAFPLDRPIDLQWKPNRLEPAAPPAVDPDQPDSALEGTAL